MPVIRTHVRPAGEVESDDRTSVRTPVNRTGANLTEPESAAGIRARANLAGSGRPAGRGWRAEPGGCQARRPIRPGGARLIPVRAGARWQAREGRPHGAGKGTIASPTAALGPRGEPPRRGRGRWRRATLGRVRLAEPIVHELLGLIEADIDRVLQATSMPDNPTAWAASAMAAAGAQPRRGRLLDLDVPVRRASRRRGRPRRWRRAPRCGCCWRTRRPSSAPPGRVTRPASARAPSGSSEVVEHERGDDVVDRRRRIGSRAMSPTAAGGRRRASQASMSRDRSIATGAGPAAAARRWRRRCPPRRPGRRARSAGVG